MLEILSGICVLLLLVTIYLLTRLLTGTRTEAAQELATNLVNLRSDLERLERDLRDEFGRNRAEQANSSERLRQQLVQNLEKVYNLSQNSSLQLREEQTKNFDRFATSFRESTQQSLTRFQELQTMVEKRLQEIQAENSKRIEEVRKVVDEKLQQTLTSVQDSSLKLTNTQTENFDRFRTSFNDLTEKTLTRIQELRNAVEQRLREIQDDNAKKLEEMRKTVDEKLQGTLEKRLGESFKLVSERLEQVHQGLGEMQTLATGVGDLKKVLTNVKVRGTWGEVQLGNLLEQFLVPEQYERNVKTVPGSNAIVEFAVKLPGADNSPENHVWLPIDSKFPVEDYTRLVEASDQGDQQAVAKASKSLLDQVLNCAHDISDKYLSPPHTTDFAILYLPTEGLYAEVIRADGMVERLQRQYRVTVTGPNTLVAYLTALRSGFRTLAIQKRSSEVWQVLAAVKTEFSKFGEVIEKVQKKLQEASTTMDKMVTRTNVMRRKLRSTEALPAEDAQATLGLTDETLEE